MSLTEIVIILIISILVIICFYCVSLYNTILSHKNKALRKFEPIDNSIDELTNLLYDSKDIIEKKYNNTDLLNEIESLSRKLKKINNPIDKLPYINKFSTIFNNIFELYNKNTSFKKISKGYEIIDNKINYAKDIYNKTADEYNNLIKRSQYILIAKLFDFEKLNILDGE